MKKLFVLMMLLALLLTACSAPVPQIGYAPPEENRLVIYTSHKEEVYRPIIREFEERTGIWVDLVTGGTNELLERIAQEKSTPKADVMFGGGVETLAANRDLFRAVQCANDAAIDEHLREPDDVWIPFSALPVVLIYNTKLVDPADLTGWADLQNPKFAGRIAFADPSRSGSSFTALVTAVYACGEEILAPLAGNLSGMLASSGDVLSAVADGTCLVGVTLEETAMQHIAAEENLAIVYPNDGTSCVPDGTAVVQGAVHRENAVKFLEFTLSDEVQQLLGQRFYRRSVRSDIPAPASLPAMEELSLVRYNFQWASDHRDDILTYWNNMTREAAK